jgi:hypothetical protein
MKKPKANRFLLISNRPGHAVGCQLSFVHNIQVHIQQGECTMKLSAPKMITWWVAVVLGLLSIIGKFVPNLPLLNHYYWFMGAGWLLFAVSTVIDIL